jgi:hypothetical protein
VKQAPNLCDQVKHRDDNRWNLYPTRQIVELPSLRNKPADDKLQANSDAKEQQHCDQQQ